MPPDVLAAPVLVLAVLAIVKVVALALVTGMFLGSPFFGCKEVFFVIGIMKGVAERVALLVV
jgi:hypothetical protein